MPKYEVIAEFVDSEGKRIKPGTTYDVPKEKLAAFEKMKVLGNEVQKKKGGDSE